MLNIPQTIKDQFKTDGVLKNIRISFPNGERDDICNDKLVKESLKFDESISSRAEIKFGLCENSSLSFECVDVGNLKGMTIDAAIEIDVSGVDTRTYYSASAGRPIFLPVTIDEEEYFVVVADFPELDEEGNYSADDGSEMTFRFFINNNNEFAISMYEMNYDYYRAVTGGPVLDASKMFFYSTREEKFYGPCYEMLSGIGVTFRVRVEDSFTSDEWLAAIYNMQYDSENHRYYSVDFTPQTSHDVPFPFYRLPLGRFIVDECKRDAKMMMRKVTAYSSLGDLKIPTYMSEKGYNSHIGNFSVTNFLALSNDKIFDADNFVTQATTFNNQGERSITYLKRWDDDYSCSIDVTAIELLDSTLINNNPNMHDLLRCNTFSVSDSDREEVEASLATFIESWKQSSQVGNTPDEIYIEVTHFIKNAIRPLPYTFEARIPENYFLNVNVGDIFATNGFVRFIESISISVKRENTEILNFNWNNPNTDISSIDYEVVKTDYYPQYNVSLEGVGADGERGYSYFLQILNITARNLLESYVELQGDFGRVGRNGNLDFLNIADISFDALFPNHDLFPATNVFPQLFNTHIEDTSELAVVDEDCMISLWYEEYCVKFGRIICTYYSNEILDEDNNPTETTYEFEWDSDKDALTYDLTNNEIFKNSFYPSQYGGYTETEVKGMIAPLIEVLQRLKFYPSEMSCIGLPYIEAGDWVLASMYGNRVLTLCLSRTISGIQVLTDKMKSD